MSQAQQARYLTLICEGDRWHDKGMWEVAAIYYAAANKLENQA